MCLKVWRFTIDMETWSLVESEGRDLMLDTDLRHSFEFSNINPDYLGKKYK